MFESFTLNTSFTTDSLHNFSKVQKIQVKLIAPTHYKAWIIIHILSHQKHLTKVINQKKAESEQLDRVVYLTSCKNKCM